MGVDPESGRAAEPTRDADPSPAAEPARDADPSPADAEKETEAEAAMARRARERTTMSAKEFVSDRDALEDAWAGSGEHDRRDEGW